MNVTVLERLGLGLYAAAAGGAALAALRPGLVPGEGFTICPLRLLTGWPCPGCGMGHSLLHAFQGRWALSLEAHPLGLPLLSLWTAWAAWGLLNRARGRPFSEGMPALRGAPALAALGLVLAVYAARLQ